MLIQPCVDFGLGQTQDILSRIGRRLSAEDIQEVQSPGSLIEGFFVSGGIAKRANGGLLDQGCGLGVIFLFANDLLH